MFIIKNIVNKKQNLTIKITWDIVTNFLWALSTKLLLTEKAKVFQQKTELKSSNVWYGSL